ncbi:hypothetical protein AVEN_230249-1 [Araneus ventricosus]|uniref:Uncharacterized protein n=1 Tax=Araneus ventricosus TaxID=182803 RepID=A0A4Y2DX69_ARAVE|nr:hypothetical protein AVEN_230249-1 [Araneus ventricosus]
MTFLPIEPVLGSCKCLEHRLGAKSALYGVWFQISHLNFCSNSLVLRAVWVLSCMRMIPSLNMSGRLRRMASRWPSDYFLFPKLEEHLSGTRFSKTVM